MKKSELRQLIREEIYKAVNEVSGFESGKQFISIKLQKYPKALAKVNKLIAMIGESKFTMEMAEWLFDFFNNASFESPVSESKRVKKTLNEGAILKAITPALEGEVKEAVEDLEELLQSTGAILDDEHADKIADCVIDIINAAKQEERDEYSEY